MPTLEWDKVDDRTYHSGVDRGVLQVHGEEVVAWNGLTGVDDGSDAERKSYYLDGLKYLESVTPGDFDGKLTAITYPEEFDKALGVVALADGLNFHEQSPKKFNLSYRTMLGSAADPTLGYKIHLLYNLTAVPDSASYATISDQFQSTEFSWSLAGTPFIPPGYFALGHRPTVHLSIDSTKADPTALQNLENLLYGNGSSIPEFPSILQVREIFGEIGGLVITDNGDGTWTAVDSSNDFVSMVNPDTFQIEHADTTYLDPDTYTITDTPEPLP